MTDINSPEFLAGLAAHILATAPIVYVPVSYDPSRFTQCAQTPESAARAAQAIVDAVNAIMGPPAACMHGKTRDCEQCRRIIGTG